MPNVQLHLGPNIYETCTFLRMYPKHNYKSKNIRWLHLLLQSLKLSIDIKYTLNISIYQ